MTPRPSRVGAWDVRVACVRRGPQRVAELERGATSLWVVAEHVPPEQLASFLDGVLLDLAPVVLEGADARARGGPGRARTRSHPDSNLGATDDADLVAFARLALIAGVRGIVVDGLPVHEQGASDAQELGWVLARGAQVLRTLEEAGIGARAGSRPGRAPGRRDRRAVPDASPSSARCAVLWAGLA